ncbi:MAG: CPBP family intramembrane glutamic endopeptidase [Bacillota bacterium]
MSRSARGELFTWKPTPAAFTPVAMMLAASLLIFGARQVLPSNGLVGVAVWVLDAAYIVVPLYFVVARGGDNKEALGLTSQRLILSAAIGLVLGLFFAAGQIQQLSATGKQIGLVLNVAWMAWIVSLVYHVFAEEMLYRAWFQKALLPTLGIVPGIGLSAVLYGLAPLALLGMDPSLPPEWQTLAGFLTKGFPALVVIGLLLNVIYFLTQNIVSSTVASATILFPAGLVLGENPPPIDPRVALAIISALIAVAALGARRLLSARIQNSPMQHSPGK